MVLQTIIDYGYFIIEQCSSFVAWCSQSIADIYSSLDLRFIGPGAKLVMQLLISTSYGNTPLVLLLLLGSFSVFCVVTLVKWIIGIVT